MFRFGWFPIRKLTFHYGKLVIGTILTMLSGMKMMKLTTLLKINLILITHHEKKSSNGLFFLYINSSLRKKHMESIV